MGVLSSSALSTRSMMLSQRINTSYLFNTSSTNLKNNKSCEFLKQSRTTKTTQLIRRAFNSSLDPFSEEEFAQKMQELTLKFQVDDPSRTHHNSIEEPWPEMIQMSSIERKANSIDLPLSLRIIKRKLQMEEEEEASSLLLPPSSAVKKAFSSMVFMIRELQSFTLHNMRELHITILHRVRNEMQASFVWLFQQVFSTTPSLMVSVMILLANFTVYSAFAAPPPPPPPPPPTTTVSFKFEKLDSSMIKTFSVTSHTRKTSFNGGGDGGNNIPPPVKSGTEDGDGSDQIRIQSQFCETSTDSDVSVSGQEEMSLWNSIMEESEEMGGGLDHEMMKSMVSPVEARLEVEESMDDFKTELLYQTGLFQEPENVLLLANYAQFLYLIVHDYERAEKYFKRAAKAEPVDAEALNKYATFLWKARNDIWRAEETFLEAISADPMNSVYAANYAHFLWNTGGDDACFPLDAPSQQNTT